MKIIDMIKKKICSQNGQVALLLVLMVAVAGAVAVSVANRTVVGLKTQQLDREGMIALKGAEAGIESVLAGGELEGADLSYGTTYEAQKYIEGTDGFITADLIAPGDVNEINLDGGTVTGVGICWSSNGSSAVKISKYSSDDKVVYYAYDFDTARSPGFSATPSGTFNCPTGFADKIQIPVETGTPNTLSLRVTVFHNPTKIAVIPLGGVLPEQQIRIVSLGKYETTNVQRKVELVKDSEKFPSVFDSVLFTRGNISQ